MIEFMPPSVAIAAFSSAATAVLVKLIDVYGRRRTAQVAIADNLRDDLWAQNQELEKRIQACNKECDDWRERYNKARDEYYEMRVKVKRYEAKYGALEGSEQIPPQKG